MDAIGRELAELHIQTQETRYGFLQAEVLTCFTALDFGNTEWELGRREVAESEVRMVEKGCATIRRFLPGIDSVERRNTIEGKLAELRRTLDILRSKLGLS